MLYDFGVGLSEEGEDAEVENGYSDCCYEDEDD
jgi:hypothetical protein